MSFIRSFSNPENLYVVALEDGINLMHRVKPPLASAWPKDGNNALMIVPHLPFWAVCQLWEAGGMDPPPGKDGQWATHQGFTAEEIHVYTDTGKPVTGRMPFTALFTSRPHEWLVRLSYRRQFVFLWRVTWEYVVRDATDRKWVMGRPPERRKKAAAAR